MCNDGPTLRRISIVAFIVSEKTQQTEQTTEALTCFEKTQQQFNNRLLFLILTVTLEWRRKEEPPGFSSATQPSGVQPQEQHGSLYLRWLRNEAKTNKAAMQLRTVKFYSKNSNSSASFVFCFFFFLILLGSKGHSLLQEMKHLRLWLQSRVLEMWKCYNETQNFNQKLHLTVALQ